MDRIQTLQASLKFSSSLDDIRNNRGLIDVAQQHYASQLKIVQALGRANQELCSHPNKGSYHDPRDGGGWDCPDCGASR